MNGIQILKILITYLHNISGVIDSYLEQHPLDVMMKEICLEVRHIHTSLCQTI
jgi:hypothetical protein